MGKGKKAASPKQAKATPMASKMKKKKPNPLYRNVRST